MLSKKILLAAIVAGAAATAANADTVVFSDNFNTENGGTGVLNYTGFANWTVTDGAVDLIGNGFFDFYPGNGLFVDLDGSTGHAGTMQSSDLTLGPGTYNLSFDLGGSTRGDTNTVNVMVGGLIAESFTLDSADPLATITRSFTLGSSQTVNIVFAHEGGDNIGLILDNVSLSLVGQGRIVPLPAAAPMGAAGLALAGLMVRRRARKA